MIVLVPELEKLAYKFEPKYESDIEALGSAGPEPDKPEVICVQLVQL